MVQVHGDGRGDVQGISDGVLVDGQARVPGQAAAAQRGVPGAVDNVVEDVGAVGKRRAHLRAVPCVVVVVPPPRVRADQLDGVQPAEHHPEHVVVRLGADREGVLAEVVGRDVQEVVVDCGRGVGGGGRRADAGERGRDVGAGQGAGPIVGGGPVADPELEEGVLQCGEGLVDVLGCVYAWEFFLRVLIWPFFCDVLSVSSNTPVQAERQQT